jgi:hypothetical protein
MVTKTQCTFAGTEKGKKLPEFDVFGMHVLDDC